MDVAKTDPHIGGKTHEPYILAQHFVMILECNQSFRASNISVLPCVLVYVRALGETIQTHLQLECAWLNTPAGMVIRGIGGMWFTSLDFTDRVQQSIVFNHVLPTLDMLPSDIKTQLAANEDSRSQRNQRWAPHNCSSTTNQDSNTWVMHNM